MSDMLMNITREEAARATMTLLDKLQGLPTKEQQIIAAACVFTLLAAKAREVDLSASELLTLADRIVNDSEGRRKEFKAAALYIGNEL